MRFSPRDLPRRPLPCPPPLTRLVVLVALACAQMAAQAQQESPAAEGPEAEPARLTASPKLVESLSPAQRNEAPTFLMGERISGRPDLETVVEGQAELRKPGTVIKADRLEYNAATDRAKASGNVRINRGGNVFEGPLLELQVETFEGFFVEPRYQFLQGDAHGEASRADFVDANTTVVHNATYTTCRRKPGPGWMPDWVLKAANIEFDSGEDVGIAHGGYLSFKDVPILPVPAISFPLSDKRKSGVLPPTIGADSVNGTQLSVPYYWNIAPNRDATITPTLMTARGVDLGGEFRYLEPTYAGVLRANYMPSDKLRNADRWGASVNQTGTWDTGWPEVGSVTYLLNVNRVSDDNYWRDFTGSSNGTLTQRLLPSNGSVSWSQGPYSLSASVLKWQTLQDPTAPIVPPYDRVPQLVARYAQTNDHGFDWSVEGDFTQFEADRSLTLQPNAQRVYGLAQVSYPWLGSAGFVVPKLQLHTAAYQFDAMLADGTRSADSTVPTFSLDAGLVFERDTSYWGQNMVQTLEPRLFYVRTPYRNQSLLPNYDTGANDFNFATIFTENAYGGHDKISDNNLLTFGLTTRFLDASTGAQLARFGIAQRFRFEDQLVTLTPTTEPARAGFSDVLLGAGVNLNERWALDSTVQYNARTDRSVRSTVGARYSPSSYRVLNAAYRFQRDVSEQVDVSWQWPLNDLWGDRGQDLGAGRGQGEGRYYALGRMNYSMNERRLVDTLLGVEYDAGCWLARVVVGRVQTSTSSATESIKFELEFVGFTRLGVSPLQSLKSNISRYQNLRDAGGSNSRFSNYD
nr:LPS-assembly protein LptD [uncultured Rhodoferax sp.]